VSDYRAIAAVTATLQNLLTEAIKEAVPGASVMIGPPRDYSSHEVAEGRVNIFLYKVFPNMTWRNEELPFRRPDGTLIRRPQLALDLHYLLSFYGDDNKHIPNLLLGLAMASLHTEPYPRSHLVPQADGANDDDGTRPAAEPNGVDLAGSGLLNQLRVLSFVWQPADEQDIIQIWSTLFQVPYVVSVAYIAKVVLIEPAAVPQPALPVRQPQVQWTSTRQPQLDTVRPSFLAYAPGARLEVEGKNLDAEHVKVMIGEVAASTVDRSPGALGVLLPAGVQAGANLVRVIHGAPRPPGGEIHWDVVSNPVAFVLQPLVVGADQIPLPFRDSENAAEATSTDRQSRQFRVHFAPPVKSTAEVVLLLNEPSPPAGRRARSYAFQGTVDPSRADLLEVAGHVAPGRYLIRVQVRGVASPLSIDDRPDSPNYQHYNGPELVIPEDSLPDSRAR